MAIDPKVGSRLKGQALVEFALLMPLIAVLLMAVVDGTTAVRAAAETRSAASEAARLVQEDPDMTFDQAAKKGAAVMGTGVEISYKTEQDGKTYTYTMKVDDGSGNWKEAPAKSTTESCTFTAKTVKHSMLGSLAGKPNMTITSAVSCVKSNEAVAR